MLPNNISRSTAVGAILQPGGPLRTQLTARAAAAWLSSEAMEADNATDFDFVLGVGKDERLMRRLNELERSTYIASGSLFVWEESDDEMGLKRWTDGRVWSQSRMREVCYISCVRLRRPD